MLICDRLTHTSNSTTTACKL